MSTKTNQCHMKVSTKTVGTTLFCAIMQFCSWKQVKMFSLSLKSYFVAVILFLQISGGVAKKKGNVLVIVGKLKGIFSDSANILL